MGYYDPNNMYFIDEVFSHGIYRVFLDIGANIGVYSLIAAHQSEATVYSFEPHPFTFGLLKENININRFETKILPFQMELSGHEGHVNFTDDPGSTINKIIEKHDDNQKKIQINMTTGDLFCTKHAIKPDILKIDVEGHENRVINGFIDNLDNTMIVFVECQNIIETEKLLQKEHGFFGPYKINYKQRLFCKDFSSHEDHVFVNPKAIDRLEIESFQFEK
jgi:FkbM family methyltransferase